VSGNNWPFAVVSQEQSEFGMNKRVICARASALFATAASAAPLSSGRAAIPDNGIENDRMVGGQYGRCWRDRGQHVGWWSETIPILMGTIAAGFAKR